MKTLLLSLAVAGGDWVIWGLALASIAAVAAIIDRFQLLRAEAAALAGLRKPLLAALADDDLDAARRALESRPGSASRALTEALDSLPRGPEAAGEHLAAALSDERRRLEHRLLLLGTLGNNAPFIGLFGTVLGVIKAFHDLATSGAGPEVVMAGLSEALVATAVGLLVALPCVFAYNSLNKRVRDLIGETEALGRRLGASAGAEAKR
ncbi:MAG TPA: MotA/TolQ/ExbB proton channel family protein [Elusimicrobiota bacterium]|jgi:biopolymer transport protein ExbB/TolQ|nr:MotA/TolQ/ExbB proton channel family protein [Elusimicrobiota bacterium]